jgi:Ca2+/Na+ antiporter
MGTPMIIAAVIYISVSVLLIVSAGIFFVKAIQSLASKTKTPNYNNPEQVMFLQSNSSIAMISRRREEIIAMLERQFASSPSSDF